MRTRGVEEYCTLRYACSSMLVGIELHMADDLQSKFGMSPEMQGGTEV